MAATQPDDFENPLPTHQFEEINRVIADLTQPQIAWLSGYLAATGGLPLASEPEINNTATAPALTILYGSQTGNAHGLAASLSQLAAARGINANLISMADYKPRQLEKETLVLFIVSTQGEGEPPESAHELLRHLNSARAHRLEQLNYAVFGLGDSSYTHFCKTAKEFDKRLTQLGATSVNPRVDADIDYQPVAEQWNQQVLEQAERFLEKQPHSVVSLDTARKLRQQEYTRGTPYGAQLLESRRITSEQSTHEVHHLTLEVDPDSFQYQPGDAVGVWFENDRLLVERILGLLNIDGAEKIAGETISELLIRDYELTQLHPNVVKSWAEKGGNKALQNIVADKNKLQAFLYGRQLIDLILEYTLQLSSAALIELLHPLQPRIYSIASSQSEYADELHLTLSVVRYGTKRGTRTGGASGFMGERLTEGDQLRIYPVSKPSFHLPPDHNQAVIMIGSGTGIAPFRAFLQQREAVNATGRNWLIFGNRHFKHDFLYQLEWQKYHRSGLLNRVDLAFSRDQEEKLYVQDRLLDQAGEVYEWLESGAALYVCGSQQMGNSINDTLVRIIDELGSDGLDYLERLRSEKRYQRDLY
ncbi:MAG TPA: assimilatory sulfite reductase (NADPH) flavoprotein subunit [Chromatiales bacterium]|nr:assimilatory sulfite reductase (NADPH) flavoprotein subunit [Thiotrichales bacterium]HIP69556.1 assimilatory sulfite reductase (NADPH) flavoprotein subunit [Chromatiales bacterium]